MKKTLTILLLLTLPGCSVFMAADKKGTNAEDLFACSTRSCLISKGATPIGKPAKLVETFKIQKPTGSTSRAVLHGTMDVLTLGVWEVAGTPIEGSMNKEEYYAISVTYKSDGETIDHFNK